MLLGGDETQLFSNIFGPGEKGWQRLRSPGAALCTVAPDLPLTSQLINTCAVKRGFGAASELEDWKREEEEEEECKAP